MEGRNEMAHFVAVDLFPVLGSTCHWAIERTLSKVIGKAGVCRERAGVKEV